MERSTGYILMFAAAVCLVCSVFVAGSAVSLKPLQTINKQLDQKKKVLGVVALYKAGESIEAEEINRRFDENIQARLVDLKTGRFLDASPEEVSAFDQRKARQDPAQSTVVPGNAAKVARVPTKALVYLQMRGKKVQRIVLPIEGKGLWSTLYGFLALEADTNTIAGITFYEHGETPGLGGEVDNPTWQALWPGRKAFAVKGSNWTPEISVTKGTAGPPASDPHRVDGLSGATITSRGVGNLVQFWLEDARFGLFLANFRREGLADG